MSTVRLHTPSPTDDLRRCAGQPSYRTGALGGGEFLRVLLKDGPKRVRETMMDALTHGGFRPVRRALPPQDEDT